jgi:hypothetical protein
VNQHGNAVADGGFVENHTLDAYWTNYGCSTQWAAQSLTTQGKAFMYSTNRTMSERDTYTALNCYAYTAAQGDYGTPVAPWGGFHPTGLPSRVTTP